MSAPLTALAGSLVGVSSKPATRPFLISARWPMAGYRQSPQYSIVGRWDELAWLVGLAGPSNAHHDVGDVQAPATAAMTASRDVHQVRGILAERVIVSTMLDPFLTLRALVAYSGIGLRKLYEYLTDAEHPLPHYRVGGKIVVRRSEFDAWIAAYRHVGRIDVDKMTEGVLSGLRC
jgi:predicted DNA-binding transcriptional regulator AlpA